MGSKQLYGVSLFLRGEARSQDEKYRTTFPPPTQCFSLNNNALPVVEIKKILIGMEAIYSEYSVY